MPRCIGRCCRAFVLSAELGDLETYDFTNTQDGAFIKDMLIPLGRVTTNPVTGFVYSCEKELWACKHHDTKTGDCTVYDNRPTMCRLHGVAAAYPCEVPDCPLAATVDTQDGNTPVASSTP